ncbi:MAG TPA: aminomethyl transferase family protein [Microbacterium sp.]|uniref:aminomethyl transferase family protein n=1 Tax=Microbacterium sp. TaxID=51671 RepID=UPI002D1CBA94|nr:aminomethyl transferase family protein [Microbacterium sp.]HWI31799.1 aminomethyl transferase family protein [Microbacterium sp.]
MTKNLEDALREAGGATNLLWDSRVRTALAARVPAEFSNWRDEQRASRTGAVLFTQSHHMADLFIRGKDALRLISGLGINSFANFPVGRAKQFVAVNDDGYVIGDNILFHLAEDEYQMVGIPTSINWVQYHAERGDFDVTLERDDDSTVRAGDPIVYRYQVQGPLALDVIRTALGEEPPQLPFFGMTQFTIGGKSVGALRHGMAGEPGFELWGPWADNDAVLAALLAAGEEHGMIRAGSSAYHSNTLESGWVSRPVPAIYTGDALSDYRRWLGADSYEGMAPLGGSLRSDDITDYYLTPFDLDYGRIVSFDHEFVGRAALERMIADGRDEARRKVTLVWNGDDVERAMGSLVHPGVGAKYFNLPLSRYADFQHDRVLADGVDVGLSMIVGYSSNERSILSLAVVDSRFAEPGTEVEVIWGEEPNSRKLQVEPHRQVTLRATVATAPINEFARTTYRRSGAAARG